MWFVICGVLSIFLRELVCTEFSIYTPGVDNDFMLKCLPRETGDGFFCFYGALEGNSIREELFDWKPEVRIMRLNQTKRGGLAFTIRGRTRGKFPTDLFLSG